MSDYYTMHAENQRLRKERDEARKERDFFDSERMKVALREVQILEERDALRAKNAELKAKIERENAFEAELENITLRAQRNGARAREASFCSRWEKVKEELEELRAKGVNKYLNQRNSLLGLACPRCKTVTGKGFALGTIGGTCRACGWSSNFVSAPFAAKA